MRPEAKLDLGGCMTTQSKWYQINYRGHPKCLNAYPKPKIQKKSFNQKPEARNSDNGEIMREGWNSHMWSEIDRNCIFADGLGAI